MHVQPLVSLVLLVCVVASAPSGSQEFAWPEQVEVTVPPSGARTWVALIPELTGQQLQTVRYQVIDGWAVIGGDMVLGTHADVQAASAARIRALTDELDETVLPLEVRNSLGGLKRSAAPGALTRLGTLGFGPLGQRWPTTTIPYRIDPSVTDPALKVSIASALGRWDRTGLVAFVDETAASPALRAKTHSIVFRDAPADGFDCRARVGYVASGEQTIWLNPPKAGAGAHGGCTAGNVTHEIGHSLGLYHENMRADRAALITVDPAIPKSDPNWGIIAGEYHTTYDLCSIMHYPAGSNFTLTSTGQSALKTCQATLGEQRPACTGVGQRCQFSQSDLASMQIRFKGVPAS